LSAEDVAVAGVSSVGWETVPLVVAMVSWCMRSSWLRMLRQVSPVSVSATRVTAAARAYLRVSGAGTV
jgi:hypothetical protein